VFFLLLLGLLLSLGLFLLLLFLLLLLLFLLLDPQFLQGGTSLSFSNRAREPFLLVCQPL
jgi:hypothetical protein